MTNTYILSLSMLFKHISTETKKAAHRDGAKKWCEILCNYRTNFYDDFKQLCYKIEILKDKECV